MLRAAELDMSASCVAEGVLTLCLFPVMVAVTQQSVGNEPLQLGCQDLAL